MKFFQKMRMRKIQKMKEHEIEKFIQTTDDGEMLEYALSLMSQEHLARCLYWINNELLRKRIFAKVFEPEALYLVAKSVEYKDTSDDALSLLQDQVLLTDIVITCQRERWYQSMQGEIQQRELQLAAAKKITDQRLLRDIALKIFSEHILDCVIHRITDIQLLQEISQKPHLISRYAANLADKKIIK